MADGINPIATLPGKVNAANALVVALEGPMPAQAASAGVGAIGIPLMAVVRFTAAQVNAGAELAPAVAGLRPQLGEVTLSPVGGGVTGATAVNITGTRSGSPVNLVTMAASSLTAAGAPITIAAGAAANVSPTVFQACDVNTPLTIGASGTVATATAIDVVACYLLVP